MDQRKRERILELVKEGVLSVDEGLDLLEALAKETGEPKEDRKDSSKDTRQTNEASDEKEEKGSDKTEPLAQEIKQTSEAIDALDEELEALKDELMKRKERLDRSFAEGDIHYRKKKDRYEKRIMELTQAIKEEDPNARERIVALDQELKEVLNNLYQLEKTLASAEDSDRLEKEIQKLMEKIKELSDEKTEKMTKLHSLKMREWSIKAKEFSKKIDLPENWRENTDKTIDQTAEWLEKSSQHLGARLREAAQKTKKALQEFEWDDLNIDLSLKEKAAFEHEWLFDEEALSILVIENTSGQVHFKQAEDNQLTVKAQVKLYELAEGDSPLAYFEKEATILSDSDHLTFKIPNRKIKADLTFYLPARRYDYIELTVGQGDLQIDELDVGDLHLNLKNGDVSIDQIQARLLDANLAKGDLELKNTQLDDLLAKTVAGDIRVIGAVQSMDLQSQQGDIVLTFSASEILRLVARSGQGDVKVSLPESISFEIDAQTVAGQVKSRLNASRQVSESKKEKKTYRFFHLATGPLAQIHLQTKSGNILLKNNKKTEKTGE